MCIFRGVRAGLKDMTADRAFRRQVLETVDLDELSNAGYIFQVGYGVAGRAGGV